MSEIVVITAVVVVAAIFIVGLLIGVSVQRTITDEVRRRRDQDLLRSRHAATLRDLRALRREADQDGLTLAG
jgi:hypothetical protein